MPTRTNARRRSRDSRTLAPPSTMPRPSNANVPVRNRFARRTSRTTRSPPGSAWNRASVAGSHDGIFFAMPGCVAAALSTSTPRSCTPSTISVPVPVMIA
jgi:hypothetical protein